MPGVAGRLGASAIGAKGQVFVFGGYTVDGQGNRATVADVNAYLPAEQRWYRAADIPVPVDSAVIGVTHDRYIYLVGGRSKNGPVNNVQVYDVEKNTWSQATALPGTPVFGHAGGLADETIVYVDGAKKDPSRQATWRRMNAGWARSIIRIRTRLSGANCRRIRARDGSALWRARANTSTAFCFPGERRLRIISRAWTRRQAGGDFARDLRLRPARKSLGDHQRKIRYDVRADTEGFVFTPLGAVDSRRHAEEFGNFGASIGLA